MKKNNPKLWIWILSIFIFLFIIAIIVLAVLSTENNQSSLPSTIDIVIIERSELDNTQQQVTAINDFMTFRNNIYILTSSHPDGEADFDNISNVFYVNFTESGTTYENQLNSYFLEMSAIKNKDNSVPNIQQHAIFLGDQTYPMRGVRKEYLFCNGSNPRLFNIFRDQSEINFFNGSTLSDNITIFNYTAPFLVSNLALFTDAPAVSTVEDFMLLELTEEQATLRSDLNRDILLKGVPGVDYIDNYQSQFTTLDDKPPYFATFHISGSIGSTERQQAVNSLHDYLINKF